MKKGSHQKISKVAVGLYVLSLLMLGITGYYVYTCYTYVASIVEQGFVISENLTDTISYYISSIAPYAFYTICLGAIGYVIQKVDKIVIPQPTEVVEVEEVLEETVERDTDYESLINELKAE